MAQKYSDAEILPSIDVEWSKDLEDPLKRPYSGKAVRKGIQKEFASKVGYQYFDELNNMYRYFANEKACEEWKSDPETYAANMLYAHEGQNPYYAVIEMLTPNVVNIQEGKVGNYLDFTFDVKNNRTNQSTGEDVVCNIQFTNGSVTQRITRLYKYGESVHELIDDYIKAGTNRIVIHIQGRTNTTAVTQVVITYNVFALIYSTEFEFSKRVAVNGTLEIPYRAYATQPKYIEWILDGVQLGDPDVAQDVTVASRKYISLEGVEAGKHTLQTRTYILSGSDKFYSNTLYYEFVIGDSTEVEIVVAAELPSGYLSTGRLELVAEQYAETKFDFAVLDTRSRRLTVNISSEIETISSIVTESEEPVEFSYTPSVAGKSTLTLTCLDVVYTLDLNTRESSIGMNEATDALVLKLTARGRNNAETNPAVWKYGSYEATFHNVQFGAQDGWQDGALVLKNGGYFDVNIPLFGNNTTNTGRTIEIEFATDDVENDEAIVASCVDNSGAGMLITANNAKVSSLAGTTTASKYKTRERMKLAFVINRKSGTTYPRFIYTIINGVKCFPAVYSENDTFPTSLQSVRFGNTLGEATLKIYSIRVYNKALSDDEELGNYAIDSTNPAAIASANDVYDENGQISAEKMKNILPTLMITCPDFQKLIDATDKNTSVTAKLEYVNPDDHTLDWTCGSSRLRKQGTSSLSYPRPNIKSDRYSDMTIGGEAVEGNAYAFKHGSCPATVHTWKTDFMESSMSHNTGVARLWNDIIYNVAINNQYICRTEAQKAAIAAHHPYDVRTTVDGFPAVVFYRATDTSEAIFLGLYNFNNDKASLGVFGWAKEGEIGHIEGYDPSTTECWEAKEEDGLCLFDDLTGWDENWSTYFEGRQPDGYKDTTRLKAFAQWVSSTKGDLAKWKAEKADHIDEWKMAAYYIYTIYYTAVDQITKNSMLTTEDGQHWFYINYDNDTINGLDNGGFLRFLYNLMRDTITDPTASYKYGYQGHESVLFNNFEADDEFMSKVQQLAAAMYSVGLSYSNSVDMFVNKQSNKFCARLHNASQNYKYFRSYLEGSDYLYACQGTREAHLRYFLSKRSDLLESKWAFGSYISKAITFRSNGADVEGGKDHIKVTAGADHFYGWRSNNTNMSVGNHLLPGESISFATGNITYGNIIYILGANKIEGVDLSEFISNLATLNVSGAFDAASGTLMKSLILGADVAEYNNSLEAIAGLGSLESLETLDIRRYRGLSSLDDSLRTLQNLHNFYAQESGLTSFTPAKGTSFENVGLPTGLQILNLNNVHVENLAYTTTNNLRSVTFQNVTGIDTKKFVEDWLEVRTDLSSASLTLYGIHWENADVNTIISLKEIGELDLRGYIKFETLTYADYLRLVDAYGVNVFSTDSALQFDGPDAVYIAGPEEVIGGGTYQFTAVAFPISSQKPVFNLYADGSLVTPVDDIASYKNVNLNVKTGVLTTVEAGTDTHIQINAVSGSKTSDFFDLTIQKILEPSDFYLDGDFELTATGDYIYPIVVSPADYTIPMTNISATIADSQIMTVGVDGMRVVLTVSRIPDATETKTLTVTLTTQRGRTTTKQIPVTVKVIRIESIAFKKTYGDRIEELNIPNSQSYEMIEPVLLPENYNVPASTITLSLGTLDNNFILSSVNNTNMVTRRVSTYAENTAVCTVVDTKGNTIIGSLPINNRTEVTNVVVDVPATKSAVGGKGKLNATFNYTPSNANVFPEIESVTATPTTNLSVTSYDKNGAEFAIVDVEGTVVANTKFKFAGFNEVSKDISLVYEEPQIPFIIMNPTNKTISFNIVYTAAVLNMDVNYAIVNDYTKDSVETYDFGNVEYQNWVNKTGTSEKKQFSLSPGNSCFLYSSTMTTWGRNYVDGHYFDIQTAGLEFDGNIMSLLKDRKFSSRDEFNGLFRECAGLTVSPELPAMTLSNYCYKYIFKDCTALVTVPTILPATTLNQGCYSYMFSGCTSLETSPSLPADVLVNECYKNMFANCRSLINAPALPATTLSNYCYYAMFQDCINLTAAPELPAVEMKSYCYQYMFSSCTSLTTPPALPATTLSTSCYDHMFYNCKNLTAAPELPATTVSYGCYQGMFSGCSNLITAPVLPAASLSGANHCYDGMFSNCTSLTTVPDLSATVVASECYMYMFNGCRSLVTAPKIYATAIGSNSFSSMFQNCTSLTTAPELKAKTVGYYSYANMFKNCTSLVVAPKLPATTINGGSYSQMFYGCTSLTTAPELPATTLKDRCYEEMFYNCRKIAYIKMLALSTSSAYYCMTNWVSGVASSGIFVKHKDATWDVVGADGVPSGWTVEYTDGLVNIPEFKAKDGVGQVECTFDVLLEGKDVTEITSSNSAFTVSNTTSEGFTLAVSGITEDTTATLTIKYNENGSVVTVTKEVTAKFVQDERPFIIYNTSDTNATLPLQMGAGSDGFFEYVVVDNFVKDVVDEDSYDYDSLSWEVIILTTTAVNVSIPVHGALMMKNDKYVPSRFNYLKFNSWFTGGEFGGDIMALLANKKMVDYAFYRMFYYCSDLTVAPELPATTLDDDCYYEMFNGCSNLEEAPALPAMTLVYQCYTQMFQNCSKLTTAPALPATTLAHQCYYGMFKNCISLTTAPALPATTLTSYCYSQMFQNCSKLSYIKMLATDISASSCLAAWVTAIASSGTFVKNPAMTTLPTGNNGIPEGWTVLDDTGE